MTKTNLPLMDLSEVERALTREEAAMKLSDYLIENPIGWMLATDIKLRGFAALDDRLESCLSSMIDAIKPGLMSGETAMDLTESQIYLVVWPQKSLS